MALLRVPVGFYVLGWKPVEFGAMAEGLRAEEDTVIRMLKRISFKTRQLSDSVTARLPFFSRGGA